VAARGATSTTAVIAHSGFSGEEIASTHERAFKCFVTEKYAHSGRDGCLRAPNVCCRLFGNNSAEPLVPVQCVNSNVSAAVHNVTATTGALDSCPPPPPPRPFLPPSAHLTSPPHERYKKLQNRT
ncbi:unnamed protein product, partial [Scytosiphon promiscuus]